MGTASGTMLHCVYATDCCLQQEMEELWAMELAPMEKPNTGSNDEFSDEYDLNDEEEEPPKKRKRMQQPPTPKPRAGLVATPAKPVATLPSLPKQGKISEATEDTDPQMFWLIDNVEGTGTEPGFYISETKNAFIIMYRAATGVVVKLHTTEVHCALTGLVLTTLAVPRPGRAALRVPST